jgi:hypothetical protein
VKRLSRWQRERHIRIARKRARRNFRKAAKRKTESQSVSLARNQYTVPWRFDLGGTTGLEVRAFLDRVCDAVTAGDHVRLDFRDTKIMYPAATILLYAEIDRLISTSTLAKPITILAPKSRRVREVLKQIGFFDLTGDASATVPSRRDVVYWRQAKGKDQSGPNLELIEVVAERVKAEHGSNLILDSLWRGVTEAVANSVEHAYKHPRSDGFQGLAETKWWVFTQVKDGVFFVCVCDLGCGYQATIGETISEILRAEIASLFKGKNRDAIAIETAMAFGRSSTGEGHRGLGSRDAMSVLERHRDGDLVVISNTGTVHYKYVGGVLTNRSQTGLGFSVNGTILWWRLPLKGHPQ